MIRGKDARWCLLGLVLGLTGSGCLNSLTGSLPLSEEKRPSDRAPEMADQDERPYPPAPDRTTANRPGRLPHELAAGDRSPSPGVRQTVAQLPAKTGRGPLVLPPPPESAPPEGRTAPLPSGGPMLQPGSGPSLSAPDNPSSDPLRRLHRQAVERYAAMDSYIVRLRRREQVNGKDKPEEVLLFKFRKEPWSVYFKWLGKEGAGREVIYVAGRHDSKIHTLLAAGDMPFTPAGKRISLAPDSLLVRSASRHAITEAGIGHLIEHLGDLLDAMEKGDRRLGTARYLGPQRRPEFATPLEAIEYNLPPNLEPSLPRGGRRLFFFDTSHHLPVLILTYDDRGHEVEYYCYDRFQYPVRLDDEDFDPDKLWGKPNHEKK